MSILYNLLVTAVVRGFTIQVVYEGETDYIGEDETEALEALEACDEMELYILEAPTEEGQESIGWALIINGLDDEEKIADCSGWVTKWLDEQ